MRPLTITSCCCFDLREAGLIVGYLELILFFYGLFFPSSLFHLFVPDWVSTLWELLDFLFIAFWVYGVHTKRIGFMLPSLIIWMITLIVCLIVLALIPIFALVAEDFIYKVAHEAAGQAIAFSNGLFIAVFIFWALVTSIIWYITSIKFSLYEQMKNSIDGQNADQLGANDCISVSVEPKPYFRG